PLASLPTCDLVERLSNDSNQARPELFNWYFRSLDHLSHTGPAASDDASTRTHCPPSISIAGSQGEATCPRRNFEHWRNSERVQLLSSTSAEEGSPSANGCSVHTFAHLGGQATSRLMGMTLNRSPRVPFDQRV
ncbi:hypothetical protein MJO28_010403, partial [Puccinia striiformis f. sp. tritici]